MKILFVFRKVGHLRLFEDVIQFATQQGADVMLIISERSKIRKDEDLLSDFLSRNCKVTLMKFTSNQNLLSNYQEYLLTWIHWLKYSNENFKRATSLNERANKKLFEKSVLFPLSVPFYLLLPHRLFLWLMIWILESLPTTNVHTHLLQKIRPDSLVISPLIEFDANQVDWIKACRKLCVPSFFAVHSWDNLTNKGQISIKPDFCIVWNEFQVSELVSIHKFPWTRILVSGAYGYDHWFENSLTSSINENASNDNNSLKRRPYVLFVGSSSFISGKEETKLVKSLIPSLAEIGMDLVVRPHPQNPVDWTGIQAEGFRVFPELGEIPVGEANQEKYMEEGKNSFILILKSDVKLSNTEVILTHNRRINNKK